jgi:SAM-dependent methyltransferase
MGDKLEKEQIQENRQSDKNIDSQTVESFGAEWRHFDQSDLDASELQSIFDAYFSIFPWDKLPIKSEGFDMGCGSGRWAKMVAPRVERLNCIDPSEAALSVARKNLSSLQNINFVHAGVDDKPLPPSSQDFGYSLGVLHHIPDTRQAMKSCVELLKFDAPFLVYLYYNFDNRPSWFRAIWRISELFRWSISRLPERGKFVVTDVLAALVYWPLAKLHNLLDRVGFSVPNLPLHAYRDKSFYTMRTDSRDRFGTPLEQRFSRAQIRSMMEYAGLKDIVFRESDAYWCALGYRQT